MLQVIRPVGEAHAIGFPSYGYYSLDGTKKYAMTRNFAITYNLDLQGGSFLNGKITTVPSNCLTGENNCFHSNYDGCIYPRSLMRADKGVEYVTSPDYQYFYPKTRVTSNSSSFSYTDLVVYGQSASFEVHGPSYDSRWSPLGLHWSTGVVLVANNGVVFIAYSDYDTRSLTRGTYLKLFSIEYDRNRGIRTKTCLADNLMSWLTIKTAGELESYVRTNWMGSSTSYPSGAFSLTAGTVYFYDKPKSELDYAALLNHVSDTAIDTLLPDPEVDWAELSYQAVRDMQPWNSNGLALAKEFLGFKEQVTSILNIVKNIRDPKSWAGVFLAYKYGITLTIRDLKSLLEVMFRESDHNGPSKVSSSVNLSANKCQYDCHYSIYYEEYSKDVRKLHYLLSDFDLLPDLSNLWDLIPYSFVLDWFIDVGEVLDRLDAINRLSDYNIVGDMRSVKATRSVSADILGYTGFSGIVDLTRYYRVTSDSAVSPSVKLGTVFTNGFDHFIESGALILQKIFN